MSWVARICSCIGLKWKHRNSYLIGRSLFDSLERLKEEGLCLSYLS